MELRLTTEQQIIEALSKELKIPCVNLSEYPIDMVTAKIPPEHICRENNLIAVKKDGNKITVAMTDPLNIIAIDDIQLVTGLIVKPVVATPSDVQDAITKCFGKTPGGVDGL